jgi:hypothetical protein
MLSDKIDLFRDSCKKQETPFRNVTNTSEEGLIE